MDYKFKGYLLIVIYSEKIDTKSFQSLFVVLGLGNQSLGNNSSEENRNGFEVENPLLENLEEILMELTNFERESSKASSFLEVTIPPQLETYLKAVAEVGTTQFPWNKIKPLFRVKLEQVISELNNRCVHKNWLLFFYLLLYFVQLPSIRDTSSTKRRSF